jgi:hypothetical protein
MIDERRKRFGPYLRQLADLMGLRDWTVFIHEDPPDDPSLAAEADCRFGLKRINVAVSEKFLKFDPEEQRQTLCHELIHAHLAPMHHYLHRVLKDEQWEGYRIPMEYGVDGMAQEWALHLPLPLWITHPEAEETPAMGRQKVRPAEVEKLPEPKPRGKRPAKRPAK